MKRSAVRIFFRIAAACLVCYALFTFVSLRVAISRKQSENEAKQQKIEEQQITNEELKKALDESGREELIRIFAEKNGYAYQGEKIFIDEVAN